MSTDPLDKAKTSLGEAWKAAKIAAGDVKKEIAKAGIPKTIDDAGREIARAATSVATHLGTELEELGRGLRQKAENTAAVDDVEAEKARVAAEAQAAAGGDKPRAQSDSYPPPPPPTGGFAPPPAKSEPPAQGGARVRIADDGRKS